jgi:hypothetical protein
MAKAKTERTLAEHRRLLKAAERQLLKTRAALRAAVVRKGLDTAGIFSETEFVLRTRAKQMAREAGDHVFTRTLEAFALARKIAEDPTPSPSPFAFLSAAATTSATATAAAPAAKPVLVVDNDVAPESPEKIISPSKRI